MAKEFYTERDIEELHRRGVTSLAVGDDIVLTDLAFERAGRLGVQLVRDRPDGPLAAPVRPCPTKAPPAASAPCSCADRPPAESAGDLSSRIREAVRAKLGPQVDQELLDVIIQRVLTSTGIK
jgi:hypothetical protein